MGLFQRWFGSKSRRDEQRRAERAVYRQRLLSPRWDVVEAALGRPVPAVLRELYADHDLVTSNDLLVFDPTRSEADVCLNVNQFIPADESALAPDLVSIPPERSRSRRMNSAIRSTCNSASSPMATAA
jgi:hypothetical protein